MPGERGCQDKCELVDKARVKNNPDMPRYREYCPIAVGAEFFGDRLTPRIRRELILGSRRFNDIHRGLGRMGRTLLIQRLRELERRRIVDRSMDQAGRTTDYRLIVAGKELGPVVWALGHWAARWHAETQPSRSLMWPGWCGACTSARGIRGGEACLVLDRVSARRAGLTQVARWISW